MAHFENPAFSPESPQVTRRTDEAISIDGTKERAGSIIVAPSKTVQDNTDDTENKWGVMDILRKHKGVVFGATAAIFFALEDICMESLTEDWNAFQIGALFTTVPLLCSLTIILVRGSKPPQDLKTSFNLILCGVCFALGVPLAVISLEHMEVGDSIAIIFTMPIFSGIFGWIFLKEALRIIDIFFAIISFVGVLLIARPSFIFKNEQNEDYDQYLIGVLCALGASVTFAVCGVCGRIVSNNGISVFAILYVNCVTSALLSATVCTATGGWETPDWQFVLIIIGGGILDFIAQLLLWYAFKIERVVYVTIAGTTEVIYSFIFQYAFFKVAPDWISSVGAVCILSACVGLAIGKQEPEDENNTPDVVIEGNIDVSRTNETFVPQ